MVKAENKFPMYVVYVYERRSHTNAKAIIYVRGATKPMALISAMTQVQIPFENVVITPCDWVEYEHMEVRA